MKNNLVYTLALSGFIAISVSAQTAKKDTAQKMAPAKVIRNTMVDSLKRQETTKEITERVVETTFKNYPQQVGQPTIIINNIIVPPDYNRPTPVPPTENAARSNSDLSENKEFQEWLLEKKMKKEAELTNSSAADYATSKYSAMADKKRATFQQRFGERPARNSGAWVIPVVGVHASAFDSDVKKDKTSGRTGWNAGIDVRIRARRFFVQPGLHYLNSSMAVTDKDSLTHTKFFAGPRIHSLKLPVMIGVYLTKANSGFFKLNVKAGAVGNYIMSVDKNAHGQFTKNNLHEYAYGVNGGIGMEFGLITLDLGYEAGLTKYFKDSNIKNNMLRVTLGIKI